MSEKPPSIGRVPESFINVSEKGFFQSLKSATEYLLRNVAILNIANTAIEPWREVGSTGNPAYLNAWTTTTGKHFGFRKLDAINCVHIHGRITPGTEVAGTVIFALPIGYIPATTYSHLITSNLAGAAGGRLELNSNGNVLIYDADIAGTFYDVNIIFPLDV